MCLPDTAMAVSSTLRRMHRHAFASLCIDQTPNTNNQSLAVRASAHHLQAAAAILLRSCRTPRPNAALPRPAPTKVPVTRQRRLRFRLSLAHCTRRESAVPTRADAISSAHPRARSARFSHSGDPRSPGRAGPGGRPRDGGRRPAAPRRARRSCCCCCCRGEAAAAARRSPTSSPRQRVWRAAICCGGRMLWLLRRMHGIGGQRSPKPAHRTLLAQTRTYQVMPQHRTLWRSPGVPPGPCRLPTPTT